MLIAKIMRFTHACHELLVVVSQLSKHIQRGNVIRVIVLEPLQATYMSDRTQRCAADLAHTLGNIIRGAKNLFPVLIQQQMIIAKMRT